MHDATTEGIMLVKMATYMCKSILLVTSMYLYKYQHHGMVIKGCSLPLYVIP